MTEKRRHSDRDWAVDKRISVPTLVTLLLQAVGVIVFGTMFYAQQQANTRGIAVNAAGIASIREELRPVPTQLRVLQGSVEELKCDLQPQRCRFWRSEADRGEAPG